jgi:acyl transferase domain-containing protein
VVVPWLLDGTDSEALRMRAEALLSSWLDDPTAEIADIAAALIRQEPRGDHRTVVLSATREQFAEGLRAIAAGEPSAHVVVGRRRPASNPLAALFCGVGSDLHGNC